MDDTTLYLLQHKKTMNKTQSLALLLFGSIAFILNSCKQEATSLNQHDELKALMSLRSPTKSYDFYILPESSDFAKIPQDPRNPLTKDKVDLGKFLFHETYLADNAKLSIGAKSYSCASCHHASGGFQAGRIQGISEGGLGFGLKGEGRYADPSYPVDSLDIQPIKSPTVLNSAYQELMLWNGQFGAVGMNIGTEHQWTDGTPKAVNKMGFQGVETQAIAGMGVHRMDCRENMITGTPYKALFDKAYRHIDPSLRYDVVRAALAIAAYERTILATDAPFQKWLKGDNKAMSALQIDGATLFFGKAECYKCHTGPALNSMEFYALGMNDLEGPDILGNGLDLATRKGRGGFTGKEIDDFKFKVPQLYSLKYNPTLGHGSSFKSIRDLIAYKNKAKSENIGVPHAKLAEEFAPLGLTELEIDALTTFLEEALDDPNLVRYEPSSVPSGNCIPNNDSVSKIDRGCQ